VRRFKLGSDGGESRTRAARQREITTENGPLKVVLPERKEGKTLMVGGRGALKDNPVKDVSKPKGYPKGEGEMKSCNFREMWSSEISNGARNHWVFRLLKSQNLTR